MRDLKRSKKNALNKQMSSITNEYKDESTMEIEQFDRGCKNKNCNNNNNECHDSEDHEFINPSKNHNHNHEHEIYECECVCEVKKNHHPCDPCEPCEAEYDNCVENPCAGDESCNGIRPTYTARDARPVAIEAQRIYDAIQFQTFTDATGPNGEPLYFDYDVVDVDGSVPTAGLINIIIDEVCMNYSSLEIQPGDPTIEDFEVLPIEDTAPCDTVFEYGVCPERNQALARRNRGQLASYKERGLTVTVNDLVLELRGHCGCTKIVAYAYPAIRHMGGRLSRVDSVEFRYNTLSARICCPSNGRSFRLRQDYQTNLTVDCISKAYICIQDHCECDCDNHFELSIPSGIDLICCLENTVSVLVNDQLVVLGVSQGVDPRVVDTFANVCNLQGRGQ